MPDVSAQPRPIDTANLRFTVDAALLRELGERLVGKPYIALAELIKNAFDADAETVWVTIEADCITVEDDGHGMTRDEFENFWMRVGSPHKQRTRVSRKFGRPLTGSKGVGRLAVQFLGRHVQVTTTSNRPSPNELRVGVNWDRAVSTGLLTEVEAALTVFRPTSRYCDDSPSGTRVQITQLVHEWSHNAVARVANELWMLVPPGPEGAKRDSGGFHVEVKSSRPYIREAFTERLRVVDDLWHARIRGKLSTQRKPKAHVSRDLEITWQFKHGLSGIERFSIPDCVLGNVTFDLKVFSLFGRQSPGVKVSDARHYVSEFGGVHLFDSQFRLPYYGLEHDWLNIERDHSHRLSTSQVLPERLRVPSGMNNLPTQSRILGQVLINTSEEREWARGADIEKDSDHLQIQVSRDRLIENQAYEQLVKAVRMGLDLYAMEEAKRKLADAQKVIRTTTPKERLASVVSVIRRFRDQLPSGVAKSLEQNIGQVLKAEEAEREAYRQQANLLGALATSGMMAMSFDHEYARQLTVLSDIGARLRALAEKIDSEEVLGASYDIENWINQAKDTRRIFTSVADEESRTRRLSLRARPVIEAAANQIAPLLRGVNFDWSGLPADIQLRPGTYAEWLTVFQNILVNAANAMLDARKSIIGISGGRQNGRVSIRIEDTGVGVDLKDSTRLFEPMVRQLRISPERRGLAAGGTGLGLMIVRQIVTSLDCSVAFARPSKGYATAIEISWTP